MRLPSRIALFIVAFFMIGSLDFGATLRSGVPTANAALAKRHHHRRHHHHRARHRRKKHHKSRATTEM